MDDDEEGMMENMKAKNSLIDIATAADAKRDEAERKAQ